MSCPAAVRRLAALPALLALCLALGGLAGPPPAAADPSLSALDLVVISPALPSQLDPVTVVVNGIGVAAPVFAAPSRAGGRIALVGSTPAPSGAPPPPTRWESAVDLGTLPAGSYTLEVTQSFTVHTAGPRLALLDDRFVVTMTRPGNPSNSPGSPPTAAGSPVKVSDGAGYFWFFDSADIELTVKILDGRPVNGHYWLFAASMTDQPFTLSVMDTAGSCSLQPVTPPPCPTRQYLNPPHANQNIIDLELF